MQIYVFKFLLLVDWAHHSRSIAESTSLESPKKMTSRGRHCTQDDDFKRVALHPRVRLQEGGAITPQERDFKRVAAHYESIFVKIKHIEILMC